MGGNGEKGTEKKQVMKVLRCQCKNFDFIV